MVGDGASALIVAGVGVEGIDTALGRFAALVGAGVVVLTQVGDRVVAAAQRDVTHIEGAEVVVVAGQGLGRDALAIHTALAKGARIAIVTGNDLDLVAAKRRVDTAFVGGAGIVGTRVLVVAIGLCHAGIFASLADGRGVGAGSDVAGIEGAGIGVVAIEGLTATGAGPADVAAGAGVVVVAGSAIPRGETGPVDDDDTGETRRVGRRREVVDTHTRDVALVGRAFLDGALGTLGLVRAGARDKGERAQAERVEPHGLGHRPSRGGVGSFVRDYNGRCPSLQRGHLAPSHQRRLTGCSIGSTLLGCGSVMRHV